MGLNLDRVGAARYLISVRRDEDIVNWVKTNQFDGYSPADDPAIRDKIAELWIEAQVCATSSAAVICSLVLARIRSRRNHPVSSPRADAARNRSSNAGDSANSRKVISRIRLSESGCPYVACSRISRSSVFV